MNKPLNRSARRVIITRPVAQASVWQAQLAATGIETVIAPVMCIEPITLPAEMQALKNVILDFDHFNVAIFVSQNAVRYGVQWLDQYWPQLPQDIQYYAVGESTENLLAAELPVECVRSQQAADCSGHNSMTSEALLQRLTPCVEPGVKVLIFRGCGGRSYLGDQLAELGCKVAYAELYHRRLPRGAAEKLSLLSLRQSDILCVHSGESLQNLVGCLSVLALPDWQKMTLLVPSARVAREAKKLDFKKVHQAENASDRAMAQALETLL